MSPADHVGGGEDDGWDVEKMYRDLMKATEYRLRPNDIDAMTIGQIRLYFEADESSGGGRVILGPGDYADINAQIWANDPRGKE